MVKGPRLVSARGPKAVPHPQGSSAFRGMADLRVSQGLIAAQGTGAMPCQSGERQGRETPVDCQGRKPELYVDLLEVEECKTRREVSPRRPQPSGPPYPSLQLPQVSSCTSGHSAEHGLLRLALPQRHKLHRLSRPPQHSGGHPAPPLGSPPSSPSSLSSLPCLLSSLLQACQEGAS